MELVDNAKYLKNNFNSPFATEIKNYRNLRKTTK